MGVLTGLDMKIGSVPTAHRFQLEVSDELKEYISSGSSGGVGRKCGIDDWRGVAMAYGYQPPVFPGSDFTFTGSLDGTYGFTGTAYCEAIEVIGDIENGEYGAYSIQFSRNGALTSGSAAATDSTVPSPPCPENFSLLVGSNTVLDVTYQRLKIMCPGRAYVSSSTSGGRLRKRGAIDAEFEYHFYYDNPSQLPAFEHDYLIQPYFTQTLFWELAWMKLLTHSEYVNTEARRPVNSKITMAFNGSNGTSLGYIKDTATTTKWPFS